MAYNSTHTGTQIDAAVNTINTELPSVENELAAVENGLAYRETGTTASRNISDNEYVFWNGTMYKANGDIASGTTLESGTNLTPTENALNALNSKATYSTNEQVIGTWITGDTLYRRVIPNLSVTDNYLYDLVAANIKEMIDIGGFVISPSADLFTLNSTDTGGTKALAVYQPSSKHIRFWTSAGTWNVTLILTYTKI